MSSPPTDNSDSQARWQAGPIIEWLFDEGRQVEEPAELVTRLAARLVEAGAPVDRLLITLLTLNPEIVATSNIWDRATGRVRPFNAERQVRESERYIGSPMQVLLETGKRVRQRLDRLPPDAHRAYTELDEEGFVDYLGLPVLFGEQPGAVIVVNTKHPDGFDDHDIEQFRQLRRYLAPTLEVFALKYLARSVLDTYVGKRTSEKVLAGMIKRGDADIINAALWFSDLRNFTRLTEILPPEQLLEMLNTYFEFVSAAVTARGGEILRFIGDAMLIVFPIDENMCDKTAANAAVDAAIDAFDSLATLNHRRRRQGQPQIEFGVGLNIGEVVYGNVGAPDRLDFTVMGPAVNRTARLESLTKELERPILFSGEFAALLNNPKRSLGHHAMKGIDAPQEVFALELDC
ncbi:MAG: adenylate/guanylate cyclase domain-containing protein [Gammaproteobacteria bacterium]|nr:adenylate/guanylate cyclase domain-containing protein [Gammaproteobacteria bacterium]